MNQLADKNNDALNKIIGKNMLEQPSDNFTASVMDKLGIVTTPVAIRYEPVISRKGWFLIAAISILIFYLAISGSSTGETNQNVQMIQSSLMQATTAFSSLFSGSLALLCTLASLAVLILFGAESWYRQSRLHAA